MNEERLTTSPNQTNQKRYQDIQDMRRNGRNLKLLQRQNDALEMILSDRMVDEEHGSAKLLDITTTHMMTHLDQPENVLTHCKTQY